MKNRLRMVVALIIVAITACDSARGGLSQECRLDGTCNAAMVCERVARFPYPNRYECVPSDVSGR